MSKGDKYTLDDVSSGVKTEKTPDDMAGKGDPEAQQEEIKVKPYAGMGKEELLLHSDTKFWNTLRKIFIWLFFMFWLALICASIALIVVFPRCKVAKKTTWWEETTVYWIYPKSFQDSNNNGLGDIKGIQDRLEDINALGVDTLLIDNILESGKQQKASLEPGYDVTDFVKVDTTYGSMGDLDNLINKTHEQGLKVLMTFIPNHTGDKHAWFTMSKSNKTNAKRNYYIWKDCNTTGTPAPNNWLNMFGVTAWTYDSTRKQCYLHQGTMYEPDLNLRNGQVQQEIENALTFWLEKGVDGFYIPRASYLIEDFDLRDEPVNPAGGTGYNSLLHNYTSNLPDTSDLIHRWRRLLDDYTLQNGGNEKFLLLDGWGTTAEQAKQYYTTGEAIEMVNFKLRDIGKTCGGKCVKEVVDGWRTGLGAQRTNWPIASPSASRPTNTFADRLRAMSMLSLLLPGTGLVYYGEEIGMVDSSATPTIHPNDVYRSPMQWTNGSNAGFTDTGTPWLPVNSDFADLNVATQKEAANSTLAYFKDLLALRQKPAMKQMDNLHYAVINDQVFSFVKEWDGIARYLVAINFGTISSKDDYPQSLSIIPAEATVVMTTGSDVTFRTDDKVDTTKLELGPQQGAVLTWDYVIKERI